MNPVEPPAGGWYLQREANQDGIPSDRIDPDGRFIGRAQLGNLQYPPRDGHLVEVAVTVADDALYRRLIARGPEETEAAPVGAARAVSTHVTVALDH